MFQDLSSNPWDPQLMIARLEKEYEEHGNLVIGFDFDNTIFDCHNTGGNYSSVIKLLQQCKEKGLTLSLYTAEANEEKLAWKIEYCRHFKIEPDYINQSPILPYSPKPFYSILLDDRAGLVECITILSSVVSKIPPKNARIDSIENSRGGIMPC